MKISLSSILSSNNAPLSSGLSFCASTSVLSVVAGAVFIFIYTQAMFLGQLSLRVWQLLICGLVLTIIGSMV